MSERILNFSEFFDKYSKTGEKSLTDITGASSNFEGGFDETTYDQKPIGPNRPEAGSTEMTPPSPGKMGAPSFTSMQDEEMNAPEDTETEEFEDAPETEDVPEPEAGSNPNSDEEEDENQDEKKEETNESKGRIKSFSQFVNENYSDEEEYENLEDTFGGDSQSGDSDWWKEDEQESCPDCGSDYDEFGATCGCNM